MATIIVMPQMGYAMREGRIVQWLKHEGDAVARGDEIAEIETDKAVIPLTATTAGVLRKVLAPEGTIAPVGQAIGVIAAASEALPADLEALVKSTLAGPPATPAPPAPAQVALAPAAAPPGEEVRASPLARRLAREKGMDLARVKGTGPGGRITEKDVLAHQEEQQKTPAPAVAARAMPLTRARQAIARVTSRSMQEAPHFYVTMEVDMTRTLAVRQEMNAALQPQQVRVSVNDFLLKACAVALQQHPTLNATFKGDALELHPWVNIGIMVDLGEQGLMVPVLTGCQGRSLAEIATASRDLVERAKANRLRAEEYTGATFTVSNMGMLGVDAFTAIIFPPNSAVLAVGAVKERPVVREGQIAVARTMHMTLSVDHRVTDGAGAARFLGEVKRLLEQPGSLLG